MRYVQEVRWVLKGDPDLARRYFNVARTLIGVAFGTTDEYVSNSRHTFERDDVKYVVLRTPGNVVTVEIDVTGLQARRARDPDIVQMWVPRGFVIYPCSDAEPRGWGLPVQYVPDDSFPSDLQELAPANLSPGLETSRWTAGGLLGQVLLTRDVDAGYPPPQVDERSIVQTPHYNPEIGPRPTLKGTPERRGWAAYRLEFSDFHPQTFVSDETGRQALREWKREMYRLHNNYRESQGLDRLNPPLRGKFDIAQAISDMAYVTGWNGHMAAAFYSTYKTPNDRAGKNGSNASEGLFNAAWYGREKAFWYSGDILISFADSYEVQYIDPTGFPVYKLEGTVYPITPQQALDWWLGSPPHAEYIRDTYWNIGNNDFSVGCASVGYQRGAATTVFSSEGQWVQTGNKFWHSRHAEVPTLSWRGYDSDNLLWETWPVRFPLLRTGDDPDFLYSVDVVKQQDFMFRTTSISSADGEEVPSHVPYQYLYGGEKAATDRFGSSVLKRSPLSAEVYARGIAVAIAPDLGFVLAAAIHKLEGPEGTATYRMIVICHHDLDQPEDFREGMTRYVRVWWADMPNDSPALVGRGGEIVSIDCHPRTVIRKKFGLEDAEDSGPWNEVNGINNWRGGELIDVGSTGEYAIDLLKYDSLWKFNEDGTKAICIRSQFKPEWFEPRTAGEISSFAPSFAGAILGASRWTYPAHTDLGQMLRTPGVLSYTSHLYCEGGEPWFLELSFDHSTTSMTTSLSMFRHGVGDGGRRVWSGSLWQGEWWFETVLADYYRKWVSTPSEDPEFVAPIHFRPIAAYYSENGTARAVYDVTSCVFRQFAFETDSEVQPRWWLAWDRCVHFRGVVRADAALTVEKAREALPRVSRYSSEVALSPDDMLASHPTVFYADDAHLAFAASGCAPAAALMGDATFDPFVSRVAYANTLEEALLVDYNTAFPGVWDIAPTANEIWRHAAWLNGQRVFYTTADNPQADYPHAGLTMYYGLRPGPVLGTVFEGGPWTIGWVTHRTVAGNWQGGFAKDRDGEWVYATSLCRQPYGALRRSRDDVPFPDNPAVAQWVYTWAAGTGYFLHQTLMASYQHVGNPDNFGGFMLASFAGQAELATLTLTPGANPRSFYARVV